MPLADAASKGLLKLIAPAIVTTALAMPLIRRIVHLNNRPGKVVPNTKAILYMDHGAWGSGGYPSFVIRGKLSILGQQPF